VKDLDGDSISKVQMLALISNRGREFNIEKLYPYVDDINMTTWSGLGFDREISERGVDTVDIDRVCPKSIIFNLD